MKLKSFNISRIIICFIICAIIGQGLVAYPVWADVNVSSTESFFGTGIVTIDGKEYLKPLPPSQGEFGIKYQIRNEDNADVARVRIQESVMDKNGSVISGPEALIDESGIPIGQTKTYSGKTYPIGGEGAEYTILYSLWYQKEESDEWILIEENGSKNIEALDTSIHATYQAQYSDDITPGEEVLYTAELKSNANVRLENIEVKDSVFGTLGTIAVLNPGERAVVSRPFKVENTTESYIILSFNDPMGIQEKITRPINSASARVEVVQEEPVYKLEVTGNVEKDWIISDQEVEFVFTLKNSGNKELVDVKGIDWDGNEFYTIEQLLPGQEETIYYNAEVSPGNSYEVRFIGISPDDGNEIEIVYKAEFAKIEPKLDISCDISQLEVESGDTVTLEYFLENTGDIPLVDVRVEEPQFGEIAQFDRLEPGEKKDFSIEKEIESDTEICPYVYAKDEEIGNEYEFKGDMQKIIAKQKGEPHLTVSLSAEPSTLSEEGSVRLECIVYNDGDVTINNIEAVLKERDMNIGSILTLEPGEEKTLSLSGIGIDENESFTASVKGRTEDGETVEFISSPCEVTIEEETVLSDDGQKEEESEDNSKLSFLKNILVVIIILILLTASGLIYMLRDVKKGKKKAKKHYKKGI